MASSATSLPGIPECAGVHINAVLNVVSGSCFMSLIIMYAAVEMKPREKFNIAESLTILFALPVAMVRAAMISRSLI